VTIWTCRWSLQFAQIQQKTGQNTKGTLFRVVHPFIAHSCLPCQMLPADTWTPSYENINDLVYLEAFLKEVLR